MRCARETHLHPEREKKKTDLVPPSHIGDREGTTTKDPPRQPAKDLVESSGPQERGVDEVRAARGAEDVDAAAAVFHAVQKSEQLVHDSVLM
jgi:hypothetical protein